MCKLNCAKFVTVMHGCRWHRGVAVGCRTRDQEVAGSSLGGALQRKISVQVSHTYVPLSPSSIIWYRRKLGSKQARRAIHWPRIRVRAVQAGVWLRAIETEISAALWAHAAREELYFFTCMYVCFLIQY